MTFDHDALADQPRNDLGNARRLVARYGDNLVAVGQEKVVWLAWDGKRYNRDGGYPQALALAQRTSEAIGDEAQALARRWIEPEPDKDKDKRAHAAWQQRAEQHDKRVAEHRRFAVGSGNMNRCTAMLNAAVPTLRRPADALDAHPWLLNVENGTIDLQSGPDYVPMRHQQAHLLTRLARVAYDASADCPHFKAFVGKILPDPAVRRFVQVLLGYCLTGDTSEQKLFLFLGKGRNGKSTLLEVVCEVIGDYAVTLDIKTFLHDDRKRGGDATPDLARLPGARLVRASEPEQGNRLAETLVKTITGGEAIAVRPLFKDQFEFEPAFKLIVSANVAPAVRGTDDGIWRRLVLVPFDVQIPEAEVVMQRDLKASLLAERAGILNWLLDGVRLYFEEGLMVPSAIAKATDDYRTDNDPVGLFLKAATTLDSTARASAAAVYQSYASWCKANGQEPMHNNSFGRAMSARRIQREKVGIMFYVGIRLDQREFAMPDDARRPGDDGVAGEPPADGLE